MGRVVKLIRPDGSSFDAKEEDVGTLETLGYKRESPEQEKSRLVAEGQQAYYTTPEQKFATTVEGLGSGLTLGTTDYLDNAESRKLRARYNPGIRLASEVVGGFGLPLGEAAGAIGRGAEALGLGKVASKTAGAAGVGAVLGGTGAATHAELTGDPITVETVLAGAGWGTVWGGGLGFLAGKGEDLLGRAAKRATRGTTEFASETQNLIEREQQAQWHNQVKADLAVQEGIQDYEKTIDGLGHRHYREFRMNMQDAAARTQDAVDTIQAQVKRTTEAGLAQKAARASDDILAESEGRTLVSGLKSANNQFNNYLTQAGQVQEIRPLIRASQKSFSQAIKAAESGDAAKLAEHLDAYKSGIKEIEAHYQARGSEGFVRLGGGLDNVLANTNKSLDWAQSRLQARLQPGAFKAAIPAAEEATKLATVAEHIGNLPKSTEEFVNMTRARATKIEGALNVLGEVKSAEFVTVKNSVTDALDSWAGRLGIKTEALSDAQKFRLIHETLSDVAKAKTQEAAKKVAIGEKFWGSGVSMEKELAAEKAGQAKLGLVGSLTSKGAGLAAAEALGAKEHDLFLRMGVYHATKSVAASALLALKGAVMGHVTDIVKKWAPRGEKAFAAAQKMALPSKIEPLATRLDGTMDQGTKDKRELMMRRSEEIRQAAYGVRDTLFKSVAPFSGQHPDFAAGIHELAAKQFAYILDKMPKDPGGAFNAFKTLWQPDSAACAKFERCYEVFHDPVGALTRALESGKVNPELVEGLQEMYPALYNEFRGDMLQRLADPRVWNTMSYQEQLNYGTLLNLPIHSTMRPKFIAAQQQMYTQRQQLRPISPRIGMGSGGGRPAGAGGVSMPRMSAGTRITLH